MFGLSERNEKENEIKFKLIYDHFEVVTTS